MFRECILVYSAINEALLAVGLTLNGSYNNINVGAIVWHDAPKIDVKSNYFFVKRDSEVSGQNPD